MSGFLCAVPFIATLNWACPAPAPFAVGYVEGQYVLIAPVDTATIETLNVARGDMITANQPLAQLERRDAEIAVASAVASLANAESELANLNQGRRPEEIAVVEAGLASAQAQVAEAERILQRQSELLNRGISAQAEFDVASTNVLLANAKVEEFEADLAVANLPARPDVIKAAEAVVDQARAGLEQARWRLDKRTLSIGASGQVFDIIRNVGELAGPQAPVLSVLPEGAVKLRVYVPEPSLSHISVGDVIRVNCDNCDELAQAKISYISDHPEFTPPVIYGRDSRQKLVFLVEAEPLAGAAALVPGQIVDVSLDGIDG